MSQHVYISCKTAVCDTTAILYNSSLCLLLLFYVLLFVTIGLIRSVRLCLSMFRFLAGQVWYVKLGQVMSGQVRHVKLGQVMSQHVQISHMVAVCDTTALSSNSNLWLLLLLSVRLGLVCQIRFGMLSQVRSCLSIFRFLAWLQCVTQQHFLSTSTMSGQVWYVKLGQVMLSQVWHVKLGQVMSQHVQISRMAAVCDTTALSSNSNLWLLLLLYVGSQYVCSFEQYVCTRHLTAANTEKEK